MPSLDPPTTKRLFQALGDLLAADGLEFRVVVVGGVALALGGYHVRTTLDVDVIALCGPVDSQLQPAEPLPEMLRRAVARVGRDFGLPGEWLNGLISAQLRLGLPPGLVQDLTWHRFAGLHVGLAGRRSLIALKLFAAADQGLRSKHAADLIALAPTREEWAEASAWTKAQDLAAGFPAVVEGVVRHVDEHLRRGS